MPRTGRYGSRETDLREVAKVRTDIKEGRERKKRRERGMRKENCGYILG